MPWVSLSLVALCTVVWIATLFARANAVILPPEHYRDQAQAFWQSHPYLEMDEALSLSMLQADRPELFVQGQRQADQGEAGRPVLDSGFSQRDRELWLKDKRLRASFSAEGQNPTERSELEAELERLTSWGFYLAPAEVPPEGGYPAHRFGLIPANPSAYAFVSHMFMHASWAHILGSLLLFFLVAPALEARWGRALFAGFYLTAGIFAGAFHTVLTPVLSRALSLDSQLPLVGASGAIAGVLGSFLVLYWNKKIKFAYGFLLPPAVGAIQVAAWVVLPLWLVNEVLSAFATDAVGIRGGAAYWAQLGGFLFGTGFALGIQRFGLEDRYLTQAIEWKRTRAHGKDMVEAGRLALDERSYDKAFLLFQGEASKRPEDLDSVLGYWEASVAVGKPEEGATALLAWIRVALAEERGKRAAEIWCRAIEIEPNFPVDGPTLVKLVPLFAKLDQRDSGVLALRYVLSNSNPSLNGAMALRARQLAAGLDAPTELLALNRILALAELPVEKEERIWARVVELESDGVAPSSDPLAPLEEVASPPTPALSPRAPIAPNCVSAVPPQPNLEGATPQPSVAAAAAYDPLGLSDGRAIEIDLEDDKPPVVPPATLRDLPPPVDEADMSYFGDNSQETEPLGLMESFTATTAASQPLEAPGAAVPTAVRARRQTDRAGDHDIEFGAAVGVARFSGAERSEVIPLSLKADHLVLQVGDKGRSRLEFRRIQAVSCAVVEDVSAKPILIIDLLLNWRDANAESLQVVRIKSNSFDPGALLPNSGAGVDALRGILERLRSAAAADALPSADAVGGQPFARFGRLVDYEREVLLVAGS